MTTINYSYEQLKRLCNDAFVKFGFSEEDAIKISDVLLLADLYGIKSHGTQRLVRYHRGIKNDSIKVDAKPEIVFETPVSAVIDGHAGMGILISIQAMELAIEKAKKSGMAFVTVRNSNHYGIAGYYTKMAVEAGMIGMSMTNSESIAVHTNSRQAILGSNPIAFAMPAEPIPFWFDAATTVVPVGRVEVYNKESKTLERGWAIDETGQVSTDAQNILHCINDKGGTGGILPVGGNTEAQGSHKGYGFSMMCELLTAITSGGVTSNHHTKIPGQGAGTCQAFFVIDPKIFGDAQAQKEHTSVFLQELRDATRVDENVPIYTHGEKEHINYAINMERGIDVNLKTIQEMKDLCEYLGMDAKDYLGDV